MTGDALPCPRTPRLSRPRGRPRGAVRHNAPGPSNGTGAHRPVTSGRPGTPERARSRRSRRAVGRARLSRAKWSPTVRVGRRLAGIVGSSPVAHSSVSSAIDSTLAPERGGGGESARPRPRHRPFRGPPPRRGCRRNCRSRSGCARATKRSVSVRLRPLSTRTTAGFKLS